MRLLFGDQPLSALFQSMGAQILIMAINISTGVITARFLGPDGRGMYAAVTLWPPLLATLAVAGLNSGIVFQMRRNPSAVSGVAGASLMLGGIHSVIAIGVGLLLLPILMARYSTSTVLFAQICLVTVVLNTTQNIVKQAFAGVGQFGRYNLTHFMPQFFHLVALLSIVLFATLTPRNAALALFASAVATVLVMLPSFIRVTRPRFKGSWNELRQLRSYWSRASLMDFVFAFGMYADRLVLIPLLPPSELGLYAVAFSFSRVIQFVQPAINSVILSHMSGQTERDSKQLHDRSCRFLIAALVVGCVGLWIIAEKLLAFTYGADFAAASVVFGLLVVEASLGAVSQVTVQLFLSRDRPGVVSTIQLIVLGISIAALLVLVPHYGAMGAAISLVGAGAVRWLLLLGSMKTVLKVSLPRLYLNRDDLQYLLGRLR